MMSKKRRLIKFMGALMLGALLISGCSVKKIETDTKDASIPKIEVNVEDPNANNNSDSEGEPEGGPEGAQGTELSNEDEVGVNNGGETVDNNSENTDSNAEETVPDAGQEDEAVNSLFVSQFSSEDPFDLDVSISDLDNTETSWSFKRNSEHLPVTGYYDLDLSLYGAYFIKNTDEKVVYLTFDEGYENGYTPTILDVLKDNNVKATFFITGHYIDSQPELVQRMVDEGHIVGNHSETHPSLPLLSDEEVYNEIVTLADKFKDLTGKDMDPFLRPPTGTYSERTLYLTRKLGFRTIFYSMAYRDWVVDDQPGKEAAHDHVMDNYHNGAIILLHAVSESNTEALDSILKDLKALGYRFGSLYELE